MVLIDTRQTRVLNQTVPAVFSVALHLEIRAVVKMRQTEQIENGLVLTGLVLTRRAQYKFTPR